jgi:hypothetical protein
VRARSAFRRTGRLEPTHVGLGLPAMPSRHPRLRRTADQDDRRRHGRFASGRDSPALPGEPRVTSVPRRSRPPCCPHRKAHLPGEPEILTLSLRIRPRCPAPERVPAPRQAERRELVSTIQAAAPGSRDVSSHPGEPEIVAASRDSRSLSPAPWRFRFLRRTEGRSRVSASRRIRSHRRTGARSFVPIQVTVPGTVALPFPPANRRSRLRLGVATNPLTPANRRGSFRPEIQVAVPGVVALPLPPANRRSWLRLGVPGRPTRL